jgi:hypothetical protein
MRLTIHHTLRDILELNRTVREQRLKAWLISLLGVAHLLLGAWLVAFRGNQPNASLAFAAGGAFLGLGALVTTLAGFGAWVFRRERAPLVLEFGPSGVAFVEADGPHWVRWELFSRWYETRNLIVLIAGRVAGGDSLAVPKRNCPEAEWDTLRGWIQSGIGSPSRW